MGVYDMYRDNDKIAEFCGEDYPLEVQIKAGNDGESMNTYCVNDKCSLPDGAYVGYEGVVVVLHGIVLAVFETLQDKWGGTLDLHQVLDPDNPIAQAVAQVVTHQAATEDKCCGTCATWRDTGGDTGECRYFAALGDTIVTSLCNTTSSKLLYTGRYHGQTCDHWFKK